MVVTIEDMVVCFVAEILMELGLVPKIGFDILIELIEELFELVGTTVRLFDLVWCSSTVVLDVESLVELRELFFSLDTGLLNVILCPSVLLWLDRLLKCV